MLFQTVYKKDLLSFIIHALNFPQIYFLQTFYNLYKLKFWYTTFQTFLLSIVETKL